MSPSVSFFLFFYDSDRHSPLEWKDPLFWEGPLRDFLQCYLLSVPTPAHLEVRPTALLRLWKSRPSYKASVSDTRGQRRDFCKCVERISVPSPPFLQPFSSFFSIGWSTLFSGLSLDLPWWFYLPWKVIPDETVLPVGAPPVPWSVMGVRGCAHGHPVF